jgi:hypothetical protein
MPGGRAIGVRGSGPRASARIREVKGGIKEAKELFRQLTEGGTDITPPNYPGGLVELPGGRGTVGIRSTSKGGPPTIDVKAVDGKGNRIPVKKIKFVS